MYYGYNDNQELILADKAFIELLGFNSFKELNNSTVMDNLKIKNKKVITQKERIQANFKTIDRLFAKIKGRIGEIEELRETIKQLIKQRKMEMVCAAISSFDEDLFSLKEEIDRVNDESEKLKLEEKIKLYESALDDEKASLHNYKCLKVGK